MRRRLLLTLPLLGLVAAKSPDWRADWRHEVRELRFAASGVDPAPLTLALRQRLGVPVRPVSAQGGALAHELDRGHVEFALLDRATLADARARMHHRLAVGRSRPDGLVLVIRRVLPAAMRADLVAAFS